MKLYLPALTLFFCLWRPELGQAREPADVSLEIVLKPGEGKSEAFDQATERATRALSEDLVGVEKLEPSWSQIKAKLLKNSARFVLFIRGSAPVDTPEGPKVTVQLRLAPDALEASLREFGLFGGANVRVLPLFLVGDARGARYAWWADGGAPRASPASDLLRRSVAQLNLVARGKSIQIMDPVGTALKSGVPSSYRVETLRRDDQVLLAQVLKADVVLSGRVDVVKAPDGARLELSFELVQTRTGRVVTEHSRVEALPNDQPNVVAQALERTGKRVFEELMTKLAEATAGGGLNLNTVRLTVEGTLSYRQQNDLRRGLGESRDVRAIRERLFEPGRVTYEVDTPKTGNELGRLIDHARWPGLQVSVGEARDDVIILNVRPVSTGG